MEQTVFNPAQMRILHMMSFIKTPQQLDNLENAISQYFAQKLMQGWMLCVIAEKLRSTPLRNGERNIYVLLANEKDST